MNEVTDEIRTLIDDMFRPCTMPAASATAAGRRAQANHRDGPVRRQSEPRVFINPKVEVLDENLERLPVGTGFYEDVKRIEHCRITAKDRNGEEFVLEAEGLLAVCIQH